jgi:hypothetical protein
MRSIILCIFCTMLLIGCSESVNSPGSSKEIKNFPSIFTGEPDINGVLVASCIEDAIQGFEDYYRKGAIFQNIDPLVKIDGGDAIIAGTTIHSDADFEYHNLVAFDFGTTHVFSLAGNQNVQPFSTQMYVPQSIHMVIPNNVEEISKSNGLTITWESDNNNNNGVYIGFEYDIVLSNEDNPSMPDDPIFNYLNTEDDGSFTITTTHLSSFPTGSTINIIIGRGNIETVSVGNRKYRLIGYWASFSDFLLVQ